MSTEVVMPQMGESVAEGTITKWYKQVGDSIKKDEPLVEISTDKVDSEIPSPSDGFLVEQKYPEGETVPVDTIIAVIGDGPPSGNGSGSAAAPQAKSSPATASAASASAASTTTTASAPAKAPSRAAMGDSNGRLRLSPVVRRIASEHSVDLEQIDGTGSEGRITKKDILAHIENRGSAPAPSAKSAATPSGAISVQPFPVSMGAGDRREAMSTMRKSIADHMVRSKHISPHVATVWEIDLSQVWASRNQNKDAFINQYGFKLTFTPYFIKAAVDAIKKHPIVNSQIDGNDIVYKGDINMGMAVALDAGLIVPVIKQAGDLNFSGIARRGNDLALRARDKKLLPDEVAGGTFTITNPGIFGNLYGIPIINQPQVAILCVGGIQKRVVVDENDAIAVRPMAYVSLSFDHRIIDGATADRFMADLKSALQTWSEPVM